MRAPGSSIRQAMPPMGIWVRTPSASMATKGSVRDVDLCAFDKEQCRAFLEWNRFRRRKAWQHHPTRRINMSPQPQALARPIPAASAARNASGSVTTRTPVRSRMPKVAP